jgi:drug/metabolite transporter (DMT)-like permease
VIRLFSIEVALFLAPFVLYALFLWATREGFLHPDQWRPRVLAALSVVAIALTATGFVLIAEYTGAPAHSTYVPAHLENGQLVPGTMK